jgi:hypothetical protein
MLDAKPVEMRRIRSLLLTDMQISKLIFSLWQELRRHPGTIKNECLTRFDESGLLACQETQETTSPTVFGGVPIGI